MNLIIIGVPDEGVREGLVEEIVSAIAGIQVSECEVSFHILSESDFANKKSTETKKINLSEDAQAVCDLVKACCRTNRLTKFTPFSFCKALIEMLYKKTIKKEVLTGIINGVYSEDDVLYLKSKGLDSVPTLCKTALEQAIYF